MSVEAISGGKAGPDQRHAGYLLNGFVTLCRKELIAAQIVRRPRRTPRCSARASVKKGGVSAGP